MRSVKLGARQPAKQSTSGHVPSSGVRGLSASSSPDVYAASAIAVTSSGWSTGSVSAFVIESALM
jgi:hypothetical protein